ncbi:acetylornithine aminotransferase [Globomyces sp. JEL0801]|nr:acetylornithine aminotransferase [Globomyces sp. JEL0801]
MEILDLEKNTDKPYPKNMMISKSQLRAMSSSVKSSLLPIYGRPPNVFVRGEGCWLYDSDGKKFLDFTAGIAVNALGHNHKNVVELVSDQVKKIIHLSNLYHNEYAEGLAQRMVQSLKDDPKLNKAQVFFSNTGTEANEGAFKFARKYAKSTFPNQDKFEIISFSHAFHGRTMGALSATPNLKYQKPFFPLLPGFKTLPFNDIEALESITTETCAVIIEPIQGEGKAIPCGVGRTGKMYGFTNFGSSPDIITMAKPLANGLPLGAIVLTPKVAATISPGDHGTTFGGSPITTRVGQYVWDTVSDPKFLLHVNEIGEYMKSNLENLAKASPIIKEVRGLGLLLGIELRDNVPTKIFVDTCHQHGLLVVSAGSNTIRVIPPLNITKSEVDQGIKLLETRCADPISGKIPMETFVEAFGQVLGKGLTEEQMVTMFMKIDSNTDNLIDWDDFNMLLRAEGQKQMIEAQEIQLFEVDENNSKRHTTNTQHREMIVRVQYIESMKRYMTVCREGTICYWNERLKLQRSFKNAAYAFDLLIVRQLYIEKKKGFGFDTVKDPTTFEGTPYRWINDAIYMESIQKIAVASDDHHITFYDVMLKVAVRHKGKVERIFVEKEGDRKLKQLGHIWKRKAHGDWVCRVRYIPELKAVISCSPDPNESLVVAELDNNHKWQYHISPVNKGLNTFAYCRFPVTIVTGGTDRQIRLWNPHRLHHPMATLKGHNSPITDIAINEIHGQIISLSIDKNIKIWDIRKLQCLQTITNTIKQKPDNFLSTVTFNKVGGRIISTSNMLNTYQLNDRFAFKANPQSHSYPVRCVVYNGTFEQIVSACDGGVVNVWDPFNGQKTFRFADVHGNSEITTMSFDAKQRRLITGGRDGTIRIWNYNNGELLQELVKNDKTEVTGLAVMMDFYIKIKETTYIVATGWNQRITMFLDDPESLTLFPTYTWPHESHSKSLWHTDDVLSMAFCPPGNLATSSFNGEIVVCNLNGGHIIHRFRIYDPLDDEIAIQRRSIDKLIFLNSRQDNIDAAALVSTGGDGIIRFWNVNSGLLFLSADCSKNRNEGIFAMQTNLQNSILVTGDAKGNIVIYDIQNAGIENQSDLTDCSSVMPIKIAFKAHAASITCVEIMETNSLIVSSSVDCTVRIFTCLGEFIGVLGQPTSWDIGTPSTYVHPFLPWDIYDPTSLEFKKYTQKLKAVESVEEDSLYVATESKNESFSLPPLFNDKTDHTIERKNGFSKTTYAKQRFFKFNKREYLNKSSPVATSIGFRVYHRLQPHELVDVNKPSLKLPKIKNDAR